ncbi:MAG: protein kinase [Pirellula sp.]
MQKCALCEFDYENVNLQEGRCPQCGSIVEWPEEPEANPNNSAAIRIPLDNIQQDLPSAALSNPVSISPSEAEADSNDPIATVPTSAIPSSMDQIWEESIQGSSDIVNTIKGPSVGHTVSDSVFAILPRELRSPLNVTDTPVDYELLDIIGQGGVGVVYTARQASIDRTVAIKMLREEYRSRNEHQEKFLAEAILTGELDHPNIVPIYDLGRNNQGELFYSMKNVIGTPWDRVIQQKSTRENIDILLKVSDAVAFAHSRSVVHRDLKPENVMLGSFGEVLVMDWGIAVATEGFRRTSSILKSQAMGGTPAYMAPELATGPVTAIGPAADVYLLGAILFEILTGSPPHYGNDVMECVRNASQNIIRETSVTGELMEIAIRAMATIPRRRFRTVQAFQAAIRLYQSHSESLMLSDNAETELNKAISTKDYQVFSRAVFAFDEALSLWDENEAAKSGLARAKTEYAKTAYEKGDYDLGMSMLDTSDDEHRPLVRKLQTAIVDRNARQNRLKTIRKLAVALTGFIIVAGSVAMIVILTLYGRASKLNADLDASKQKLQGEFEKTAEALKSEEIQREKAIRSGEIADQRRQEAEIAQRNAELSRLESIAQRQQAEESSYFAEIGLVGASIQQNQFSIASEILSQQENSSAKSKIRHWEWGRHRFLVRGGSSDDAVPSVATIPTDESVECIDRSTDGKWIAIGKTTGECELWRFGEKQPTARMTHGRSLSDLDFDSTGNLIATSGIDDDNVGTVCIWRIQEGQAPLLEKKLAMKSGGATAVSFSNDAQSQYVVAGDNKRIGRIWKWREVQEVVLLGHVEAITCVDFSPSNELVVTSSNDGTVRVWRTEDGLEVQRFSGHNAPVMSVAFAPSGKQIASGGADRRILVWTVDPSEDRSRRVDNVIKQLRGESLPTPSFHSFDGHDGTIQDLSFSLDGTRLVSSANDNLVCVWQVPMVATSQSSKPLFNLRGHGGWVRACRFSADGTHVISGGDDRSWKTWRLSSYREKQFLNDDTVPILDAHYSPSGEIIATSHSDGTVGLWNPISGERIARLNDGHEYLTNKARLTPDEKNLVTAAGDNTMRLWDVQRGTQIALMDHSGRDGVFSISQNGNWLVAGGDDLGLGIWNLATLTPPTRIRKWPKQATDNKNEPTLSQVTSAAISDDGKLVVIGDKYGTIEFWDLASGTMTNKLFGHSETVVACFFLASESNRNATETMMTVSSDGSAAWWDARTGKAQPRERLRHFSSVQLASVSTNGKYLVSCASLDQQKTRLWVWDLVTGEKVGTKDLSGVLVQDIVFSSTENPTVYVTTSDAVDSEKKIWQWNAPQNEWRETGSAGMRSESLWGAIPTEDDSSLLTYGGRGARLWRMSDGIELKSFRPSAAIRSIAFDSSGRFLATASDDGSALVWNVAQKASTQKLVGGHSGSIRDLTFSLNDESLFTSGTDGRIVVWNVSQGKPNISGRISESTVVGNALRLSPEGTAIAVGCDDNSIRLYDPITLLQKSKFMGHSDAVTCLSFSSDGQWIVSGSQDKTIRVWSVASGKEITKLQGHSASLMSVEFSSDGLRILSASQDTTARLWDIGRIMQSIALSSQAELKESSASLGEVLSLEFHSSEASVAEFSPDGRTILTAGMDGKAVLWPSERIAPSIRISNPNLTYQEKEGVKPIDPMAILCQPGTLDLDGATIEMKLETEGRANGKLVIDQVDGIFSADGETIFYHSTKKTPLAIGSFKEFDGVGMQITLSSTATHTSAEQLIRHLAYQVTEQSTSATSNPCDVIIQINDHKGNSGNSQPERVRISFLNARN